MDLHIAFNPTKLIFIDALEYQGFSTFDWWFTTILCWIATIALAWMVYHTIRGR